MLAVVFECERFHTLLYGKTFTVITDHKPLITICNKSIHSTPARLQRMLLRIQAYQFIIVYRPGSTMIVADALSRLPAINNNPINLDSRVDIIDFDHDTAELCDIAMINFGANL